jgi:hypothetical protein
MTTRECCWLRGIEVDKDRTYLFCDDESLFMRNGESIRES